MLIRYRRPDEITTHLSPRYCFNLKTVTRLKVGERTLVQTDYFDEHSVKNEDLEGSNTCTPGFDTCQSKVLPLD